MTYKAAPCLLALSIISLMSNYSYASNEEFATDLGALVITADVQNKTNLATKTKSQIKHIPQTINIITQREIKQLHSQNLNDVMSQTAGVAMDNSAGNRAERFLLRGFVSTAYSTDGFVINPTLDRAEGFLDLTDIEQIEVLKGPSSVLFGRSNPGGVINITSKQPTDYLSSDINASIGSFNHQKLAATVSSALNKSGSLKGRLSASAQNYDMFMGAKDGKRILVSSVLDWQATDKLNINTTLRHTNQTNPFVRGLPADGENHKNPIELGLRTDSFYGEPWSKSDTRKTSLITHFNYQINPNTLWKTSLSLSNSKTLDTGIDYKGIQENRLKRRYNDRMEDAKNTNITSEITHKNNWGNTEHHWLFGMDLAQGQLHFTRGRKNIDSIDLYNPVQGAIKPEIEKKDRDHIRKADTVGVYLQDQINLGSKLKLLVGTRFDKVKDSVTSSTSTSNEDNYNNKNHSISNRLGAVYIMNNETALFANYSEGFMPNSGVDKYGNVFQPEKSKSYEAGIKFDYKPIDLESTFSLFYIDKYNVKTKDPTEKNYSVTAGKQNSTGAELDITVKPNKNLTLIGSLSYNDAKIKEDNQYKIDSGLINAPKFSGSLWASYQFKNTNYAALDKLTIGAGLRHVGKRLGDLMLTDTDKSKHYYLPAYTVADLGLNYKVNDRFSLDFSAKNIFNKYYIASASGSDENRVGMPRNYMLSLNYRY